MPAKRCALPNTPLLPTEFIHHYRSMPYTHAGPQPPNHDHIYMCTTCECFMDVGTVYVMSPLNKYAVRLCTHIRWERCTEIRGFWLKLCGPSPMCHVWRPAVNVCAHVQCKHSTYSHSTHTHIVMRYRTLYHRQQWAIDIGLTKTGINFVVCNRRMPASQLDRVYENVLTLA